MEKHLLNLKTLLFVFSGYPGVIIKNKNLLKRKSYYIVTLAKFPIIREVPQFITLY